VKDLLTGMAAVLTAGAAVFTLVFEQAFTDTTALQKKIKTHQGVGAGTAKELAQQRRRRQKLGSLGILLFLAFALSSAALFLDDDNAADCRAACPPSPSTKTP
jgi:hypothetical protein